MATLWVFGDSFSTPFDSPYIDLWAKEYINWKGYTPKIYSQIIATKLEMKLETFAKGGLDNYTILETICENIDKIKDDDILIIGWSSTLRFRLIDNFSNTLSIIPNFETNLSNIDFISSQTIEEVLLNRFQHYNNYDYELFRWTRLINKSLNCKVIHWKWEVLTQYETIKIETNNEINDGHYSESGHLELAKDFIKHLNLNKQIYYAHQFTTKKEKKIF